MSVWTVSPGHIDVLVNALAQSGVLPPDLGAAGFRAAGQALWDENHRSVNHYYDEATPTPRYALATTEAPLDPLAALCAADCYDYQSCEHGGWAGSEARRLTAALRDAVLAAHPGWADPVRCPTTRTRSPRYTRMPRYKEHPWGFDSLAQAETGTPHTPGA